MAKSKLGAAIALYTILVLGAALGNMSQTALNAMLPTVIADFGQDVSIGQWATTIYMLSLGIAVPLTSYLTKKMTTRSFVTMSLALFVIGSGVDAIAPSFIVLVIGRILQAFSAGFMMPVMQTVAMIYFPPEKQGTMMGIGGIAMGFAPNIGPTVGSLFTDSLGWRSFFVLLLALSLAFLIVGLFIIKNNDKARDVSVKLDFKSFILSAIGFGGVLAGLSNSSSNGFASPLTWAPLAIGIVIIVIFMRRQNRTENPLINLSILKSRKYTAGFWMQNLLFGSFMGVTLVIPLWVQGLLGGTALDSGMVLLPGAITALIFNPLSGVLGDKIGKVKVIRAAAVVFAIGSLLALFFDENTPIWVAALCQAVRGIGISSSISCTISWMLSDLPGRTINDGTSFSVLCRQASASLGTAIMVFIITALTGAGIAGAWAYRTAFGFSAVLAIIMLFIAFSRTHSDGNQK